MPYGEVLVALADPTRRGLYEQLRRGRQTVGELADRTHVTQPAVSQHLRVLSEARLVSHEREGTRRYYQASQEGLAELREYIESLWDDVLAAYANARFNGVLAVARSRSPRAKAGRARRTRRSR
jgi:DNA-binding transcriptional ArsR family regulator